MHFIQLRQPIKQISPNRIFVPFLSQPKHIWTMDTQQQKTQKNHFACNQPSSAIIAVRRNILGVLCAHRVVECFIEHFVVLYALYHGTKSRNIVQIKTKKMKRREKITERETHSIHISTCSLIILGVFFSLSSHRLRLTTSCA